MVCGVPPSGLWLLRLFAAFGLHMLHPSRPADLILQRVARLPDGKILRREKATILRPRVDALARKDPMHINFGGGRAKGHPVVACRWGPSLL